MAATSDFRPISRSTRLSLARWYGLELWSELSQSESWRAARVGGSHLGRRRGVVPARSFQTPSSGRHSPVLDCCRRAHGTEASPPHSAALEPGASTAEHRV